MALNIAGKNALLGNLSVVVTKLSLHSGPPGTDGSANEVTGLPYVRQPVSWATPANGQVKPSGNVIFDIPVGNVTVTTIGLWREAEFVGTMDNLDPASQPFTNGGQYVITDTAFSLI